MRAVLQLKQDVSDAEQRVHRERHQFEAELLYCDSMRRVLEHGESEYDVAKAELATESRSFAQLREECGQARDERDYLVDEVQSWQHWFAEGERTGWSQEDAPERPEQPVAKPKPTQPPPPPPTIVSAQHPAAPPPPTQQRPPHVLPPPPLWADTQSSTVTAARDASQQPPAAKPPPTALRLASPAVQPGGIDVSRQQQLDPAPDPWQQWHDTHQQERAALTVPATVLPQQQLQLAAAHGQQNWEQAIITAANAESAPRVTTVVQRPEPPRPPDERRGTHVTTHRMNGSSDPSDSLGLSSVMTGVGGQPTVIMRQNQGGSPGGAGDTPPPPQTPFPGAGGGSPFGPRDLLHHLLASQYLLATLLLTFARTGNRSPNC